MLRRIWDICCSLKLTIYLASGATFLAMGGSLLIPFRPRIFGKLDEMPLWEWMSTSGAANLGQTWWVYLATILIILLGLNTLCCFLDWIVRIRARWRKTGEYLIHLGFVLLVIAYVIASTAGSRYPSVILDEGETIPLPGTAGELLRLNQFDLVMGKKGYPVDMKNDLSVLAADGTELTRQTAHTNTPLWYGDLIIVPGTFRQIASGFVMWNNRTGQSEWKPGTSLHLGPQGDLRVLAFYPDVQQNGRGELFPVSSELNNPAFILELRSPEGTERFSYLLRSGTPAELSDKGIALRALSPIMKNSSMVKVSYDPGYLLAVVGASAMTLGVCVAFFSFYAKRKRNDRPDII